MTKMNCRKDLLGVTTFLQLQSRNCFRCTRQLTLNNCLLYKIAKNKTDINNQCRYLLSNINQHMMNYIVNCTSIKPWNV